MFFSQIDSHLTHHCLARTHLTPGCFLPSLAPPISKRSSFAFFFLPLTLNIEKKASCFNTMLSSVSKLAARRSAPRVLSRGFAKEIKFGIEGRAAMLKGVNTLADAVQVRLQPKDLRSNGTSLTQTYVHFR